MLPVTTSSVPVLPPASALSPAIAVEAPARVGDTSRSDRAFDGYPVGSDSERVVVEAVARSTHLPDEQLPYRRALADKRQYHDSGREEFFDAVSADQS
jgi:hypothetical protein